MRNFFLLTYNNNKKKPKQNCEGKKQPNRLIFSVSNVTKFGNNFCHFGKILSVSRFCEGLSSIWHNCEPFYLGKSLCCLENVPWVGIVKGQILNEYKQPSGHTELSSPNKNIFNYIFSVHLFVRNLKFKSFIIVSDASYRFLFI